MLPLNNLSKNPNVPFAVAIPIVVWGIWLAIFQKNLDDGGGYEAILQIACIVNIAVTIVCLLALRSFICRARLHSGIVGIFPIEGTATVTYFAWRNTPTFTLFYTYQHEGQTYPGQVELPSRYRHEAAYQVGQQIAILIDSAHPSISTIREMPTV